MATHKITSPVEMKEGYVYRTTDRHFIAKAFESGYIVIQNANSSYTIVLPEKCPTNHGLPTS